MKNININYGNSQCINVPLPEKELQHLERELIELDGCITITTTIEAGSQEILKVVTEVEPKLNCPKCNSDRVSTINHNISKCLQCGYEISTRSNA